MKKVKMLMDFQGSETKGAFYLKDSQPDLEDYIADRLVKDGRAVFVNMPHANPANEPQFEEAEPVMDLEMNEMYDEPLKKSERGKK